MVLEDGLRQCLGLNVSHIVLCIDVGNTQDLLSNEVTDVVITYVDMFGTLIVNLMKQEP